MTSPISRTVPGFHVVEATGFGGLKEAMTLGGIRGTIWRVIDRAAFGRCPLEGTEFFWSFG